MICRRLAAASLQASGDFPLVWALEDHTDGMSTSTWCPEADHRLRTFLATHELSTGGGPEEPACSLVAINLALTGRPSRSIPDCMSAAIGYWIICVQTEMPDEIRNGRAWKDLLPRAAATGRDREHERLTVLLDYAWNTVLPLLQGLADRKGFGDEWRRMCAACGADDEVRMAAARGAGKAARGAADHAGEAARDAARAVASARHGDVYPAASSVAEVSMKAARAIGDAAADSSVAASTTASRRLGDRLTVGKAARAVASGGAWSIFDPVEMLRRAIWAGSACR